MLPKRNRLAKERDIKSILRKGRMFHDPRLTVRFIKGGTFVRLTVVVSTKVAKQAVRRNRIKRLMREFVRLHLAEFVHGDYMVQVKPVMARFTASEVLATIEEVFRRSNLLRP